MVESPIIQQAVLHRFVDSQLTGLLLRMQRKRYECGLKRLNDTKCGFDALLRADKRLLSVTVRYNCSAVSRDHYNNSILFTLRLDII